MSSDAESHAQRLTRNWEELLQELRVMQTGVQILTGFLLTVPFSNRFKDLSPHQVVAYLVVLTISIVTTGTVIAPVAFHRMLFRKRERDWLVGAAHISARAGLVLLVLSSSGVLYLAFDVVVSPTAGIIAGSGAVLFFVLLWGLLPWLSYRLDVPPPAPDPEQDDN
jgi:hypothetical protein